MNGILEISGNIYPFATKKITLAVHIAFSGQQTLQHFMGHWIYPFYSFDNRYVLPESFN